MIMDIISEYSSVKAIESWYIAVEYNTILTTIWKEEN